MTAVAPRPARRPQPFRPAADPRLRERREHAVARSRRRDTLEASAWLAGVGGVSFMLASGTVDVTSVAGLLTTLGRIAGIAASTMIMAQLVLIARIPLVERVIGHDRAARIHSQLGRIGFLVIIAHIVLLIAGYAMPTQTGLLAQTWDFVVGWGGPMFMASVGFVVLCAVVVTSYAIVRRRWRYESWHAVHVFSYLAVGLSIPHQLTDGESFMSMGLAWWYWVVLWTVAVGGLLAYRVVRPLARFARHRVRVAAVGTLPDGSTVVAMHGRHLRRMNAQGGQFLLFRFLQAGMWGQAHPYSLSRTVRDGWMRITVKPLGDGSSALRDLRPGTRVMVEGPLGTFHDGSRSGDHLVLAGAGVGITPILALLEDADIGPAGCTVIVRAHSEAEIPHLDEFRELAAARGAALHVLTGGRGDGWAPAALPARLAGLVPTIAGADVYACGPQPWVEAVMDDAARAGVPAERRHAEEFAW
ncbi:ferredoxin reductase family protein [Demequina sp. SYSU T00192]|uniref:Ferredoxin reductase family protein n=1 Tax=Demequina litoralis TaxID=3051660 RepID=A0ABT8G9I1_9MICO|nr:ferredoxin reductase family protein [Demequina sp. SYSU T00192]MDN4475722.1 ferredoxin reductase family protein [Demequina sp. SYSU T00192]